MTREEYTDHFVGILNADKGVEIADITKHVLRAIDAGLQMFWAASNWSFKESEYSLSLSATADDYDLPDDFDSFRVVWEEETSYGYKLQHFARERFVEMMPKLSAHSTGTPRMFTIYRDEGAGAWKISFYPRTAGSETIKIAYYLTTTTEPDNIPDKAQSALEACIAFKVYPPGHPSKQGTYAEALDEIHRLERIDRVDQSDIGGVMSTGEAWVYRSPNINGWIIP